MTRMGGPEDRKRDSVELLGRQLFQAANPAAISAIIAIAMPGS